MEKQKIEKMLLEKRILVLNGSITAKKIDKIRAGLVILGLQSKEEIKLLIDSQGGEIVPGLVLFDMMQLLNIPITGIVNGQCSSMALIILQGCHKRLATKHNWFFCHAVHTNIWIPLDDDFEKKFEIRIEEARRNQMRINNILIQRTGKSLDEIEELMKRGEKYDERIPAEKAKELGLIDEIIEKYELF